VRAYPAAFRLYSRSVGDDSVLEDDCFITICYAKIHFHLRNYAHAQAHSRHRLMTFCIATDILVSNLKMHAKSANAHATVLSYLQRPDQTGPSLCRGPHRLRSTSVLCLVWDSVCGALPHATDSARSPALPPGCQRTAEDEPGATGNTLALQLRLFRFPSPATNHRKSASVSVCKWLRQSLS